MQLDWLDGQMTDQCGQDRRPVSHSQAQEKKGREMMGDTYGLSGSISSESADLQSYLESKLGQRFHTAGLTKCKPTWNQMTTLAGRSLFRLQLLERRIEESGSGLWRSPLTSDARGSAGKGKQELPNLVREIWLTVTAQDNIQMTGQYTAKTGTTLGGAARQCNAKTEKSGSYQLNPKFSLWLMGFPIEWGRCAERVTPLSRKSRQK